MSLSPETMTELMALADGELEGEARERMERLAAESEEARQVVEAMRSPLLGTLLAEVMDQRTAAADGIADAVMTQLAATRRQSRRAPADGGVVRLADARARRGVTRGQLAVLGGALVLAATILLYMRSSQDAIGVPSPVASIAPPISSLPSAEVRPAPAPSALAQGAHPAQGVEVDEIDSPAHDVTVFEIPVSGIAAAASGGSPSSVVIMIEDEPVAKP